ncbi:MAG: AAA family ATPase, partial [Thermosphaera sp.]
MDFDSARSLVNEVVKEIRRVYVGKEEIVKLSVATLVANGHLLIEGYPGTGKTLLGKALAKAIGGEYARIQGHPDILPSDILGFHIYRLDGSREFVKGPVFSNIL